MILGICGMIGSGKSTLAKGICDDPKILPLLELAPDSIRGGARGGEVTIDGIQFDVCVFPAGGHDPLLYESTSNWELIELDEIGNELLSEKSVQKELRDTFGEYIFDDTVNPRLKSGVNLVSRKKLGEIVFEYSSELQKLEDILHPAMKEKLDTLISEKRGSPFSPVKKNLILVAALPETFEFFKICDTVLYLPIEKETAWERVQKRNPELSWERFKNIWKRQEEEYFVFDLQPEQESPFMNPSFDALEDKLSTPARMPTEKYKSKGLALFVLLFSGTLFLFFGLAFLLILFSFGKEILFTIDIRDPFFWYQLLMFFLGLFVTVIFCAVPFRFLLRAIRSFR